MKKSTCLLFLFLTVAAFAEVPWNLSLSGTDGGYWKKRVALEVTWSDNAPLPTCVQVPGEKLTGAEISSFRICGENGREYLFEVLDKNGEPKHEGLFTADDTLLLPADGGGTYFLYFDNAKAYSIPDWWQVKQFVNGGFETGHPTGPNNWVLDPSDDTHQIVWSDASRTGKKGIQTSVAAGAEPTWIGARQSSIPVDAGKKYRFTAWVKGENIQGYAGWFAHVGAPHKTMMLTPMASIQEKTFDWQQITMEFTVPEGASVAMFGTVLRGTGVAWYDDASLQCLTPEVQTAVSCRTGDVETIPVTEYFAKTDVLKSLDSPRYTWIRVFNFDNASRTPIVNVQLTTLATRWRVEMDADALEIHALDGTVLPYQIWNGNLFFQPTLPAKSCSYLLLVEKPTAVSRRATAVQKQLTDGAFPGTSMQGTGDTTKTAATTRPTPLPAFLQENNRVQNGDLETLRENGLPTGWTNSGSSPGVELCVVPSDRKEAFGEHSIQVKLDDTAKVAWQGWHQRVAIQGGRNYLCGMWLKTKADGGSYSMHIHFATAEGKPTATDAMTSLSASVSGTQDWTLLSSPVAAPQDAAWMTLHLTCNYAPATLTYDNVFVSEFETGEIQGLNGGKTGVFQVSPIVKVFRDTTFSRRDKADFHPMPLAQNEQEAAQFAIRFDQAGTYRVKLEECGIPTRLFVVGNVPINYLTSYYHAKVEPWQRRIPTKNGKSDGWVGWWPDPILPFGDGTETPDVSNVLSDSERAFRFAQNGLLEVPANETRVLYLIATAKKETAPGTYRGQITLENIATGQTVPIPYGFEVLDFAIPDEPAVGAIYDIRMTRRDYWKSVESSDAIREMVQFMGDRRLASDRLPVHPKFSYDKATGTVDVDWTEFDAAATWYFNELKVKYAYLPGPFYCFGWGIPPKVMSGEAPYEGEYPYPDADRSKLRPEYKKVYQDQLRAFWNHMKEKGWEKKFVLYISDEPFAWKPEIEAQMKACCDMIHEVAPEIPIYCSSWHHHDFWDDYLNVWGIGHYGLVSEEQIQKSKARGDRIWWTTDGQMCTDTPYCAVERLLPYWCVKYGADAYEFWGASWYTFDPYRYGWHAFIHQSDQPGVEYYVRYPNGDGFLFYPNRLIGADEIISSVRLEQAREGVEDAAYLQMLQAEIARVEKIAPDSPVLKNAKNTLARAFDLVKIPNAGGRFSSRYLPHPEEVDTVKALLGKLIVQLRAIPQK
ncbi:MAG: DUF4091 domain-containing protein [Planctomycetia bacterium]|nr:DUF4091 domain-containing protein [Planctomycetia bacterium]